MTDWDRRYLEMAQFIATHFSKDPSTKCGAVIVRPDRTVAGIGYNGFPRGTSDDKALYDDRETKYSRIVHCEVNALVSLREPAHGYTLYTWPFACCDRCASVMIQGGIKRAVAPYVNLQDPAFNRWEGAITRAIDMYKEAGVDVVLL